VLSKASDPVAICVYAEAEAALQHDPALSRLDGVPFIAGFIQSQIVHERERLGRDHMIPRVGVGYLHSQDCEWLRFLGCWAPKVCPDLKQ
jgi:hypothetical protein